MTLKLRHTEIDSSTERIICIGMIISDRVIQQLAPILDIKLLPATYMRTIVKWCLDFYSRLGKAPRAHIKDIFESEKRNVLDDDLADVIEALLISLNDQLMDEKVKFNEDYVIEEAEKYIKSRKALMLSEDVAALISKGRIIEAEGMIAEYNIPKRPSAEGQHIFDPAFWAEEEVQQNILFRLPGALNDLVGPIERDSFISILAPEKRGKSWWLMELGLRAFRARCNVAFFSCGDMTKRQMRRRFRHMLTGVSPKRNKEIISVPVPDCWHNQTGKCPLGRDTDSILISGKGKQKNRGTYADFPDHVPCSRCMKDEKKKQHFFGVPWYQEQKLADTRKNLDDACAAILKRAPNKRFQLFCFPPASVSVDHIKAHLDILQQQELFIPDVIIIDYADILMPEHASRKKELRHQINDTWMALRALSQERNCAVLTATQAKADALKKSQVNQWDASEDKRKLAHVTAMLALNQTPEEKRSQIMRVSNLAIRDDDFDVERNIQVLQCLAIGKPILHCYLHREVPDFKHLQKEKD